MIIDQYRFEMTHPIYILYTIDEQYNISQNNTHPYIVYIDD